MSLNLSPRSGFAHNTAAITDVTAMAFADFDGGTPETAGNFRLAVDTTAAAADIDLGALPTTLQNTAGQELIVSGVEMTVAKANDGGKSLVFTDPLLGAYSYVSDKGESLTLVYDGTEWLAKP